LNLSPFSLTLWESLSKDAARQILICHDARGSAAANEFSYLEGPWSAKTLIFEVPLAGCIWDLRAGQRRAKLKAVAEEKL